MEKSESFGGCLVFDFDYVFFRFGYLFCYVRFCYVSLETAFGFWVLVLLSRFCDALLGFGS